ncbi:MAG: outer membrane lipoprotein-sorting protein [Verrucomicrobiaceae bacterium]
MFRHPACFLVFLAASAIAIAADPTGPELAERLDHVRRPEKSFEVRLNITEIRDGKTIQQSSLRVMARKQPDDPHFDAVSLCLEPDADKGKSVLAAGSEVWFYDLKSKRPTQLSAHHFRGKFFVADALSTSFAADYTTELTGEETIKDAARNDVLCYRVKMKRRQKEGLTPEIIEYWVDKKLLQPIRGQFYTGGGKLLRTSYYAGYAKVLEDIRPTRVVVVSNTERGLVTDIKFEGFALHEWPQEMFVKDSLPRVSRGELP